MQLVFIGALIFSRDASSATPILNQYAITLDSNQIKTTDRKIKHNLLYLFFACHKDKHGALIRLEYLEQELKCMLAHDEWRTSQG